MTNFQTAETLPWLDTHCHFDFEDFDRDREALWQTCRARGLKGMVIPGVTPDQWPRMAQLCSNLPDIYFSVGLHPCWLNSFFSSDDWQPKLAQLRQSLLNSAVAEGCVAIGECGLDQFIEGNPEQQEAVLACHLEVAGELDMPILLHCRRAHNPLLRLLKKYPVPRGGVVHAFSGSAELARQYWDRGFYLGVGGTITYERANKTRNAVTALPLEALLLETDAPDMPLCGRQGQRNSPEMIPAVGAALAQLRGDPLEKIANQTTANACALFRLNPT